MNAGPVVADVTELEHRAPAFPEVVARLEALGFREIGRFAILTTDRRGEKQYSRKERDRLSEWKLRPAATILAARDETAYAAVDTVGDALLVRLRTELDDGSLVETLGLEREGMLRPRPWLDPYAGITSLDTHDRSVRLLHDVDPSEVVASHAEHVGAMSGRRASLPSRHHDRDGALRLWVAALDHAARHQARARTLSRVLIAVPTTVWAALVIYLIVTSSTTSYLTILLVELLGFLAVLVAANLVSRPVARQRWWRAPYLAES